MILCHSEEGEFLAELLEHMREDFGDASEARLAEALADAERLARDWDVELREGLPGATCSLVLAGVRENREVVLRLPLPDWERGTSGLHRAFAGHGGVAVLRADPVTCAALLPRLRPGTTLDKLPEEAATDAWIALARRLRGAEGNAPGVETYLDPLLARSAPEGLRLATDVPSLVRRLLVTSPPPRLLHGDLHHFNVLRHGDAWVAIDPEGVSGDPAYEAAAFLRNPIPAIGDVPDLSGLLQKRILRLALGLGEPPARIWGWGLVRTAQCVWTGEPDEAHPWWRVTLALDALADDFRL